MLRSHFLLVILNCSADLEFFSYQCTVLCWREQIFNLTLQEQVRLGILSEIGNITIKYVTAQNYTSRENCLPENLLHYRVFNVLSTVY
jgi:hypothetical protein